MNPDVSIRRQECLSHLEDLERRTGFLRWSGAELRRLDSRGFRHQSRYESARQAEFWAAKRQNVWRNCTLICPDTNGGTLLIDVILERQLKSKGRKYSSFLSRQTKLQQRIFLWFQTSIGRHKHTTSLKTVWYFPLLSFHIFSEFGGNKTSHQSRLTFEVKFRFPLRAKDFKCLLWGEASLCRLHTNIYPPANVAFYFSGSHFGISAGVSLPSGTVEHLPH